MTTTNRIKVLRFSSRILLSFLNMAGSTPQFVDLPVTPKMPEGMRVLSVFTNWAASSIEILVSHPSFPELPEGDVPPVEVMWDEWRVVSAYELMGGSAPTRYAELPDKPGVYWWREFPGDIWQVTEVKYDESEGKTFTDNPEFKGGEWAKAAIPPD